MEEGCHKGRQGVRPVGGAPIAGPVDVPGGTGVKPCKCGAEPVRPGQRNGLKRHAEYNQRWRAAQNVTRGTLPRGTVARVMKAQRRLKKTSNAQRPTSNVERVEPLQSQIANRKSKMEVTP
jgi:hypothetical protein